MHLVWVKVGGLWPLTSGGRLRSFHTLAELSRRHRVTVLTTHAPGSDWRELRSMLPRCEEIISVPHAPPKQGTPSFAFTLARSACSRLPVDVVRWTVPALRRLAAARVASGSVDLCVADFLLAAPNVPIEGPTPTLLFEHNVEYMIWRRLGHVERRPWRRLPLEVEWRKLRRYEARTCARVALTITVSEADRRLLAAEAPSARIQSIPTGVDTAFFAPAAAPTRPGALTFTGSMDWYPNEDGILYFVREVLPLVRRQAPQACLTVVGRNPSARLLALESPHVRVTGTVADIRPYVAEGEVYVVPIRVGGGTRLKILEALAMGKAVVSTRVGAEGLPLTPGVHFVQADEPAEFAAAVISLLADPARRHALSQAGRRLVQERHSWRQVAHEFESRCDEVARGRVSVRA